MSQVVEKVRTKVKGARGQLRGKVEQLREKVPSLARGGYSSHVLGEGEGNIIDKVKKKIGDVRERVRSKVQGVSGREIGGRIGGGTPSEEETKPERRTKVERKGRRGL